MEEYQIDSSFNMLMISNTMYQLAVFILLWITFRRVRAIYAGGADLLQKSFVPHLVLGLFSMD